MGAFGLLPRPTMTEKVWSPGFDPAEGALLVPIGKVLRIPRHTTIKDVDEMPYHLGGRAAKPSGGVLVKHANGQSTIIAGLGVTENAELQELAYASLEKQAKRDQRAWFDQWRAKRGLVPFAQFDAAFKDALERRVQAHRRNPISDPARQPGWEGKRLY